MKKLINTRNFLAIYAGVLTVVFTLTVLTGATQNRKARFGEIDVERINVIEPDGTVRLVTQGTVLGDRQLRHGARGDPRRYAGHDA